MKQWLVRRGLLVTLPVASLIVAFGACSSESADSNGRVPSLAVKGTPTGPAANGPELPASPAATARLARLTQQFSILPRDLKEEEIRPLAKLPPRLKPAKAAIKQLPPEPRSVLRKGDADRFVHLNGRVRAQVPATIKQEMTRTATVDLPLEADGFVRVQPETSDIGIEFATTGARSKVGIEVADGVATYAGAALGGGDIVMRVSSGGVEDFVVLNEKPAQAYVDYLVNVKEVAGLRFFANTLEFLDVKGTPVVRVDPPLLVDSDAIVHQAQLSLRGCKADTSPLAPWGRPVTSPDAAECSLRVSWDDTKVVYPAIVDPVWSTAKDMGTARYRGAATRLSSGHVLTCGGIGALDVAIASCEEYDPTSNTWTPVSDMKTARYDFNLLLLAPASDDVLAVGGFNLTSSERLTTGTWKLTTTNFSAGYFSPVAPVVTSDGAYVVLMDVYNRAYRYQTSGAGNDTWYQGAVNPSPIETYRYDAAIIPLPGSGTVMRVGGSGSTYFNSAERYRPSTDSWSNPGNATSMTTPRSSAQSAVLDGNRVIVYSGYTGATYTSTAEVYNVTANSWAATNGIIPNGYYAYTNYRGIVSAVHSSGRLLSMNDYTPLIYDPGASSAAWSQLNTYSAAFQSMGSQSNAINTSGKILLAPVRPDGAGGGAQKECRLFDLGGKGSVCSANAECQTGLVCSDADAYDGVRVCCDNACSNACSSCRATHKGVGGGVDGACGNRIATEPLYGTPGCPYSDQSTCGNYGYTCDGKGACQKYPKDYTCVAGACKNGATQYDTRTCDGAGTCIPQHATDCAAGYQCSYGQCQTQCYNDVDYCAANYYCQTWYDGVNNANTYKCYSQKDKGVACSGNSTVECKTGLSCVDGFCCDSPCSGLCQACSAALTGGSNGTCKSVLAGTATGECQDNLAPSCLQNGKCDGAGACQKYVAGTVCKSADCATFTSKNNADTCNGTGTCTDNGVTACAANYGCSAGVCQTQCTDDTQCASNAYCDIPTKQCVADKTSGQSCVRDAACTGNANCVDGVCCDTACGGTCRSCLKNRTGLAADGICGDILDDTDPENECTKDVAYPASCQAPGTCDGAGACRVYAKVSVTCANDKCAGATLTKKTCNGAGSCDSTAVPCYPFTCDAVNNVCKIACTEATQLQDCVEGSFCQGGTCVGQKPIGAACNADSECKGSGGPGTGHCADKHFGALEGDPVDTGAGGDGSGGASGAPEVDHPGVCCDTACGATCFGCKASTKGGGSDGTCEAVRNNIDAKDQCNSVAGDECGLNGQCNGLGQCSFAAEGTACGVTSCQGDSVQGQICNGTGICKNEGKSPCAPYVCRDVKGAFQCTNPCADDNDCQDGYYCSEAACKKKLANGKTCTSSGICNSGFCVDGQCCDVSCNGQCEACDSPGNEGICTPVSGEPHGTRVKCDHAGEECGGACDGVNASACKYAPNGDACGTPTCNNDLATSSTCNGQGVCKANKDTECTPYTCGTDDTCLTRCEQDADCGQGYACDETTQRCLPSASAASCSEDRLTSQGQNGADTPCKPFLCVPASGTCAVSCAFTTDCSPDFVCEPSTKTCLPAPTDSGGSDDSSCACRAAGAEPPIPDT